MKKLILLSVVIASGIQVNAQQCMDMLWHKFVMGGAKGYYTQTHQVSYELMEETKLDFGDAFDNQSMQIPVEDIVVTAIEERVITKYSNQYAMIIFKNIDDFKADVFYYSQLFDDVASAKAFQPLPEQFTTWYTPAGYTLETIKPAMPELSKKDVLELTQFLLTKNLSIKT